MARGGWAGRYAVPGHTKGSAAFLARGVLFMGDSAEVTTEGRLAPAKRLTSDDPALNRASLAKLAERLAPAAAEVRAIAPAHSGVLVKGLAPLTDLVRAP
jgi:glyoxylase-like metal-dependent hydrolase (beta-lactamase superfamily II)